MLLVYSRPSLGPRWAEAQFILKQKIDDASATICEGDRITAPWDLCLWEFRGNITNYHYSIVFSLFLFSLSFIFHHFLGIQTPPNSRVQFAFAPKSINPSINSLSFSIRGRNFFSLLGIWKGNDSTWVSWWRRWSSQWSESSRASAPEFAATEDLLPICTLLFPFSLHSILSSQCIDCGTLAISRVVCVRGIGRFFTQLDFIVRRVSELDFVIWLRCVSGLSHR